MAIFFQAEWAENPKEPSRVGVTFLHRPYVALPGDFIDALKMSHALKHA